ncbi:MAG: NmrA family NAD(P)-binding protein [Fibrobacteria bacterium]
MYVITGATGKVGGGIAERLLAAGKKVKAIARSKDKLAALAAKGAEVAAGDGADAVFLAKAFAGAECVFLMVPPDLQSADIQAHYDKFGGALAKAVKESGVKSVMTLSSVGGDMPKGNGPVAGLYRFEQLINGIAGVDALHLRPCYFMENQFASIGMIKGMGINGGAIRGDLAFPQIATRDISEAGAKRMLKKDWSGKSVMDLLGPRDLSMDEATAALGKAIGKPDLKYVQFPYSDALQGMIGAGLSKSVSESFIEMNKGFNEKTISIPKRTPANTTPTPIEEVAKAFAGAYQAG